MVPAQSPQVLSQPQAQEPLQPSLAPQSPASSPSLPAASQDSSPHSGQA